MVAPFGGAERRLSTNPIVVAAPTEDPEQPFVLDMATSVGAEGKVRVARNRGAELPPQWILDGDGRPSTDPWDLYGGNPPGSKEAGALLPVGGPVGHKGFGLSMAVELLAGALTPAGPSRPDEPGGGNGLFMLAIDPERFVGLGTFTHALDRPDRLRPAAAVRRGLRRSPDRRRARTPPPHRAARERHRSRPRDVARDPRGSTVCRRRAVRRPAALAALEDLGVHDRRRPLTGQYRHDVVDRHLAHRAPRLLGG